MIAEIVSIGTELLLGDTIDTHAATMGRILASVGLTHTHRQTVGDNWNRLTEALKLAHSRADVVVTIGGLGPTQDDLTRDAVAHILNCELIHDNAMEQELRAFFAQRGMGWSDSIARQADVPACGRMVRNPNGTAPGLICARNGKHVLSLPGPRNEFNPMAEGPMRDYLLSISDGTAIFSRTLKIAGMGESEVETALGELMTSEDPTLAPYAKMGEVHLRLSTRAATLEESSKRISPFEGQVRDVLGTSIFGADEETLEQVAVRLLTERGETLAVAESLTGGLVGARLTSVPGASEVFMGGLITYSHTAKTDLLGVPLELIETHGTVSAECALAMAEGVRARLRTDHALSLTGNAGPGTDGHQAEEGVVFLGYVGPGRSTVERIQYRPGREAIRVRSAQAALNLLRLQLIH